MDPQLEQVLAGCCQSSLIAAKTLFPSRFHRDFDEPHQQILDALDDDSIKKLVICAPRGVGKTSLVSLLVAAQHLLFLKSRFIVMVSQSATTSIAQSENLKKELTENPLIRKLFGDIKTDTFAKDQWVASVAGQETMVYPRGAGQVVRGMIYRDWRPDLILIDDLEDSELVTSAEQRAKLKKLFFADLLPVIDEGESDHRFIYVDTLKHEDSLLAHLLEHPEWHAIKLEICDDNLKSYFPNFMSDARIKAKYEEYQAAGELTTFYQEYRSQAHAGGEDAVFQARFFKYYEEADFQLNHDVNVENLMLLDPARTANMNSAETGIVCVAVNMKNSAMYVRDVLGAKLHPHEMYNEICSRIEQFNITVLGVEVTGLHEFITHPLKNELARRNINVEFVELHARGGGDERGKVKRIKSLVHYYRLGLVYHNKTVSGPLEAQLLSFPRSRRWDLMDAFGYIPELLEKGERFMRPYDGQYDDPDVVNDEMLAIEDWDDMSPIDFRYM